MSPLRAAPGHKVLEMIAARRGMRHESRRGEHAVRERRTVLGDVAQLEPFALAREHDFMIAHQRSAAHRVQADLLARALTGAPCASVAECALAQPANRSDLGIITGIGPRKLEEYGDAVLDLVRRAE